MHKRHIVDSVLLVHAACECQAPVGCRHHPPLRLCLCLCELLVLLLLLLLLLLLIVQRLLL